MNVCVQSIDRIILMGGKPKYSEKTQSQGLLVDRSPTGTGLGSKPSFRNDRKSTRKITILQTVSFHFIFAIKELKITYSGKSRREIW